MTNALKQIKKQHLYAIIKDIYLHQSSTMNELSSRLNLSQPSIRNMVRYLQDNQAIIEIGNDQSSGGRCPTRFALNQDQYHILCLYIKHDMIDLELRYINEIVVKEEILYDKNQDLTVLIEKTVHQYNPHCVCIGVEGIIKGYMYITDHHNQIENHTWIKDLKDKLKIPVYLQNDVKMMHQGRYFHHQLNHSYYVHINEVGIGGSYFEHDGPLYGKNGLSGEMGLIHKQGITLNQLIRQCQSQDEFNQYVYFILEMIITMFDPQLIDISIHHQFTYQKEKIDERLKNYLGHHVICYDGDYQDMLFEGLLYTGVVNLMKERIENNEKI